MTTCSPHPSTAGAATTPGRRHPAIPARLAATADGADRCGHEPERSQRRA